MTIAIAITNRRLITFVYKDKVRVVEPHTYGRNKWGQLAVCGYQVGGGAEGWRTFMESDMGSLTLAPEKFEGPRPGYQPGDGLFKQIIAEL